MQNKLSHYQWVLATYASLDILLSTNISKPLDNVLGILHKDCITCWSVAQLLWCYSRNAIMSTYITNHLFSNSRLILTVPIWLRLFLICVFVCWFIFLFTDCLSLGHQWSWKGKLIDYSKVFSAPESQRISTNWLPLLWSPCHVYLV